MKFLSIILPMAAVLALTPVCAGAYTIADNYYGGTPTHGWAPMDVIGDYNYYDILGMDVTVTENIMTVKIYSSFFDKLDTKEILDEKTNMGDLFISTSGWDPAGTEANHYQTDTMLTPGTKWDYVVALDHHGQTSGDGLAANGTASLYEISDGSIVASNLNGLNANSWIYRKDQMYRFTPDSGAITSGNWAIEDISGTIYDRLTLTFDISDLQENRTSPNWAFHWAMSCGNDVIEGEAPIPNPEPSTFLLMGLGIVGVAYLRRRRKQ
jgi:hypothetical protein